MDQHSGKYDFDLIVIGSGPGGQVAAVEAVRGGLKVAVVDRKQMVGGVCLHTGTMPSKSLREAVMALTGQHLRCLYPFRHAPCSPEEITMAELKEHIDGVIARELGVIGRQMERHRLHQLFGIATFLDNHTLCLKTLQGKRHVTAQSFIIATGTTAHRPPAIPFNDRTIIDSDQLYTIQALPRSLVIVGGGVIAAEYASILALLGIRVTLVNRDASLLPYLDADLVQALESHLLGLGVKICNSTNVMAIEGTKRPRVRLEAEDLETEMVMVAAGRQGMAGSLNLGAVGVEFTPRGFIPVNERFQTTAPHILACGDIIRPSTASTAKVQGRLAAHSVLGLPLSTEALEPIPYGVYTIPEIAYIGRTEGEIQRDHIPYVRGVARYREVAKGEIMGDDQGMMKLLFHRGNQRLLGVHIIGTYATEIIQIGQAAMHLGGHLSYFLDSVFNYPTIAECYRIAAFDAEACLAEGSRDMVEVKLTQ